MNDLSCHMMKSLFIIPQVSQSIQGMQEMAFQRVQFQKFPGGGGRGGIPQTPLEAHVFGTPVRAFSTHVHLFHLGILYSKMLPKTLYAS